MPAGIPGNLTEITFGGRREGVWNHAGSGVSRCTSSNIYSTDVETASPRLAVSMRGVRNASSWRRASSSDMASVSGGHSLEPRMLLRCHFDGQMHGYTSFLFPSYVRKQQMFI